MEHTKYFHFGNINLFFIFKAQKKEDEEMRRNNEEVLKDEQEKLKIEKLMEEKRRVCKYFFSKFSKCFIFNTFNVLYLSQCKAHHFTL